MALRNPRESLLRPMNQSEVRISALRKEEEERIQRMKCDFEEMDRQMKEDLRRETESFRALHTFPHPQLHPGALIENLREPENFGPNSLIPLALDPITANSSLSIFANLSNPSLSNERPQILANPGRINVPNRVQVPGRFSSVGVSENQINGVRVIEESIQHRSFSRHFSYYKEEQQ
ncbi:putative E3 ubiquitin-protein ligase TRIML1 [Astyanax mexicanus]|uniref:Putative E3 ubiquitin-protein ligase TRIML1 n=1 Tax=Astyanax mexicanus TaxID=7994 RepID=A0A8T2KVP7_ASTMX|nr:putative E3 ubiquitin-protein ligase TRIML1 [Astyanax mexicanus]